MHPNSMKIMTQFVTTHLGNLPSLTILDVGSMNVNGSYNELFRKPNWVYKGMDISEGPNVDIVSPDPYKWPIEDNFFDDESSSAAIFYKQVVSSLLSVIYSIYFFCIDLFLCL